MTANTLTYGYSDSQSKQKEVVWTLTFYVIQPRLDIKKPVSEEFCSTHISNSINNYQSNKKMRKAENGVYIKYLNYKTTNKHGLGFNEVNAEVWTVDTKGNKTWSLPMWEYQQNLTNPSVTNTVWATNECKGKFVEIPSISG